MKFNPQVSQASQVTQVVFIFYDTHAYPFIHSNSTHSSSTSSHFSQSLEQTKTNKESFLFYKLLMYFAYYFGRYSVIVAGKIGVFEGC